jgi:G3E family GTPase
MSDSSVRTVPLSESAIQLARWRARDSTQPVLPRRRKLPAILLTGQASSGKTIRLQTWSRSCAPGSLAVLQNAVDPGENCWLAKTEALANSLAVSSTTCELCVKGCKPARIDAAIDALEALTHDSYLSAAVVECTGGADALQVAACLRDPDEPRVALLQPCVVVCVVDVLNHPAGTDMEDSWARQILAADWVILSQADVADASQVSMMERIVTALNPFACVVRDLNIEEAMTVPALQLDRLPNSGADEVFGIVVTLVPETTRRRYRAADLRAVLAQSTAGIWRVQGLVQVQEGVARVEGILGSVEVHTICARVAGGPTGLVVVGKFALEELVSAIATAECL